jgi:thiamine kinase-like enzyme
MKNLDIRNTKAVSRFYNHLTLKGNRVIKGVPEDRHVKETEWFKEAEKRIPNNIPHIYCYNKKAKSPYKKNLKYYEMQAIDGPNLYQWVITNKNDFSEMFARLIKLTKRLHKETYKPNKDDIYQMYFLKPRVALDRFIKKSKIDTTNGITINGQKYVDPIKQLKDTYVFFEKKLLKTSYSFIHGDLTMSNIVVGKRRKLYLIDPRGGFGKTNLVGDVRYDIAKIYYSIVGNFDSLNNGRFSFKKKYDTSNSYDYSIADNGLGDYKKSIIEEFKEQHETIRFIHATIWLSLIPHANNLNQKWCTFCHGVYLLNTINDYEN